MAQEGYIQTKVRDMKEEVEQLISKVSELKSEISHIESLKKEVGESLERVKEIEKKILSKEIISFRDEIVREIAFKLKEMNEEVIKSHYSKMIDILKHKIDKETYPYIGEQNKSLAEKIMGLQTGHINMIIDWLNRNYNFKIPKQEQGKLMFSEKEAKKWLKKSRGGKR